MKIKLITLTCLAFATLVLAGCAGGIEGETTTIADATPVASTTKTLTGTVVLPSEGEASSNLAVKSLVFLPNKALDAENVVYIEVRNPVTNELIASTTRDNSTGDWSVDIDESLLADILDPDDPTKGNLKIYAYSDYESVRQLKGSADITTKTIDTGTTDYDSDAAASMVDDSDTDGSYDMAGFGAAALASSKMVDSTCMHLAEDAFRPNPSADGALCKQKMAANNDASSMNMQTVLCRMNAVKKMITSCLASNKVRPGDVVPRLGDSVTFNKAMSRPDTGLSITEKEALLTRAAELCPDRVDATAIRQQMRTLGDANLKNFKKGFIGSVSGDAEMRAAFKGDTDGTKAQAFAYTYMAQEMETVGNVGYVEDHANRIKEGMRTTFTSGAYQQVATGGIAMGTVFANGMTEDGFKEMMGDPDKLLGMVNTFRAMDTTGFSHNELRMAGTGLVAAVEADGGSMDQEKIDSFVGITGTGLRQGTMTSQQDARNQGAQVVSNYQHFGDTCSGLPTQEARNTCWQTHSPEQQNIAIKPPAPRPLFAVSSTVLEGCGADIEAPAEEEGEEGGGAAPLPQQSCTELFGGWCTFNGQQDHTGLTFSYTFLNQAWCMEQNMPSVAGLFCSALKRYVAAHPESSVGGGCVNEAAALAAMAEAGVNGQGYCNNNNNNNNNGPVACDMIPAASFHISPLGTTKAGCLGIENQTICNFSYDRYSLSATGYSNCAWQNGVCGAGVACGSIQTPPSYSICGYSRAEGECSGITAQGSCDIAYEVRAGGIKTTHDYRNCSWRSGGMYGAGACVYRDAAEFGVVGFDKCTVICNGTEVAACNVIGNAFECVHSYTPDWRQCRWSGGNCTEDTGAFCSPVNCSEIREFDFSILSNKNELPFGACWAQSTAFNASMGSYDIVNGSGLKFSMVGNNDSVSLYHSNLFLSENTTYTFVLTGYDVQGAGNNAGLGIRFSDRLLSPTSSLDMSVRVRDGVAYCPIYYNGVYRNAGAGNVNELAGNPCDFVGAGKTGMAIRFIFNAALQNANMDIWVAKDYNAAMDTGTFVQINLGDPILISNIVGAVGVGTPFVLNLTPLNEEVTDGNTQIFYLKKFFHTH